MYKTIFTILFSLFLAGAASAAPAEAPQERLVASDGTVYKSIPSCDPEEICLAPGESRRDGETCETTRTDWLHQSTTCTWQETISATEAGLVWTAGGSETNKSFILERMFVLIGIGFMAVAMVFIMISTATATTAAFVAAAATATAATVATFATFAAVAAVAAVVAVAESKKWFYIFASAYIALMAAVFFMV